MVGHSWGFEAADQGDGKVVHYLSRGLVDLMELVLLVCVNPPTGKGVWHTSETPGRGRQGHHRWERSQHLRKANGLASSDVKRERWREV